MAQASDWRSSARYAYVNQLHHAEIAWELCAANLITAAITQKSFAPSDEEVTPPKRLLGVGVCDFALDPNLPADRASPIWLPHIDSHCAGTERIQRREPAL
jgi:hypothetical protein